MSIRTADEPVLSVAKSVIVRQPCPGCQRALPIRRPRHDEAFAKWECEACHATFDGLFVQELAASLADRVRLSRQHFDAYRAEPIPPELRKLVAKFLERRREKQSAHQRRRNRRELCDLDAIVVALDERWIPDGQPTNAVVIDLAEHGLGMMTAQRVKVARLAIQIRCPAGLVQLLGQTAWSNFVSDGFQNMGVAFQYRLGRTALNVEER